MTAVKINIAYSRTLNFEKTETEVARKIFRSLVNGADDHVISYNNAKPLQDYMTFRLLDLAKKYKIPVCIHTGLQAGFNNNINNSNPTLLINIFKAYPDVNFVLFHGSYPFGGELSTVAKNYKNVYVDMNWIYTISPSYSERYLNEWIETVPVSRLTAFGGDAMVVENVYSELIRAKKIISDVLCNKVREGYISESEAKMIAKMILHDNAAKLYGLE
jgi:predicted TIM-barrel fold metal-dependent hydrolase